MSYEDLLSRIYAVLPGLQGKLNPPHVVYVRSQRKTYLTFESQVLVGESDFLKMEKVLRDALPNARVSLRVTSPSLKEDLMRDMSRYSEVLNAFLRRNYPASAGWTDQIVWRAEDGRITVVFPTEFALQYMASQNVAGRLRQALMDIFGLNAVVDLTVAGDRENRLAAMRSERREELVISREELEKRTGIPAPAGETRAKEKTKNTSAAPKKKTSDTPAASAAPAPKAEETFREGSLADTIPEMTGLVNGKPIMGRSIADAPMEMRDLASDSGLVVVQGDIFMLETKELKGGEMLLLTMGVTDYTSSILCKIFFRYRNRYSRRNRGEGDAPEEPITDEERAAVQEKVDRLKTGMNVKLRGECLYDSFARELSISVRDIVEMQKIEREDRAEEKRIELHMHTNMSTMDALTPPDVLIDRAVKWGHPAVAITDHGVVQSFPAAFKAAKKKIKLIPGCEGYLIEEGTIVSGKVTDETLHTPVVVLDFEATGLNVKKARIIEIGAVRLQDGQITDQLSLLVDPGEPLKQKITQLTGITDSMLEGKDRADIALPQLLKFIGDCPIAAHNAKYDVSLLKEELKRLDLSWDGVVLDTLTFARKLYPDMKSHKLGSLCRSLGVSLKNAHRAVHDAGATAQCLQLMFEEAEKRGIATWKDLNEELKGGAIGESWHIILLVKSQEGLVNLNRLVTISHLEYFRRRPHMPRAMIQKYREGLIIGSACEAGELFRAVLNGEDHDTLRHMARFYDYLEIQPIGNNEFLVREGTVKDDEALRDLNRVIVGLGEELGIPVVATGDVHFLDPHHAINRAIIQAGQGYDDPDKQPPLYFKTTEEMLEEFSYLGPEKAREVVIENPRKIADQVADNLQLFPKHPKGEDTFQPFWDDAEDNIQNMTWGTAREMYGDDLPDIVTARLKKELRSIVGYGYCTLYNIAQKLVGKSLEHGYLVGSRGSVGSSLVARMCGITEVNALPPHYRCTHCRKGFFDVDQTKYHVGVDLPDRNCPDCGQPLTKDGFDIPFEVFLGFEGDKVPDIDLNFSGEFQNRAHHYVEELFGHDHVFRAGTISGLADKTAYGYVAKYLEERGIQAGNTEKERLAMGCQGVKRTTGQHPGGMVVVPKEFDINQFTAVQHPADDLESDFTTTHFDFNSMHDILVKLDCLGHDDPTMMHMLEELTGIHFTDVPLDDQPVRSLFKSPAALGVTEDDILCNTGTYGVPEFGTSFVRKMLEQTEPTTMEELIRISGLSHGTDVWTGNAQEIIARGDATLSECVCCRDDIMNYLISRGVPPKLSFTTMESVRKGKGLKPEMEAAMEEHEVPEWFVESCRKIKYMFPKGHAVAYVTMSLRVAWFKVHRPEAYYCAYFTIRGDGFDAGTMLLDPDTCRQKIRELRSMDKATQKDKEQQTSLELVLEMNMRGIRFLPVDLYRSDVRKFRIEDGNLRCPFTSLSGLGEAAAQTIVAAREQAPFISVEDLQQRGKAGSAVIALLRAHGSLEGLPETSQLCMF